MLQTMKRNNKDNSGYRKPAGKSGDYKPAPRNERPERENRSSSSRFFGDRDEKPRRSDKPSYNAKPDWNNKPERGRKPYPDSYGSGRSESRGGKPERTYGTKPSYGRSDSERGERPDSRKKPPYNKFGGDRQDKPQGRRTSFDKPNHKRGESPSSREKPSYRFGSEWADKPQSEGYKSKKSYADNAGRNSFGKKGFFTRPEGDRFDSNKLDQKDPGEYKTVYKGRGKDQKPRYETVKKEEAGRFKSSKKFFSKTREEDDRPTVSKPNYDLGKFEKHHKKQDASEEIRLNKYIANAGVCSRREADTLIANGLVSVNGTVVKELGHKVSKKDKVQYQGKTLNPEKPVYLLLNKPKDFITTTDDPMERKTVMNLVNGACEERIFPVGRLDRNTTGLLFFTNDGELADKLASPANKIKKIYQVTLDKPLTKKDGEAILEGLTLEDGPVEVDDMQVLSLDRTILGLEIHVGRNRIVRRIFAHLGYDVVALDRVTYAGLTKKDLARGSYRFLTEKEVINLKFFS